MPYYVKSDPRFLEFLRQIRLPIDSLDDLTRLDSKSLALFSDYSLNNKKYEVYGYFLTDYNHSGNLVSMLRKVKEKHKILEREIKYERRKDGMRRKAFPDWINVVRNYPGLVYMMAYDKRIDGLLYSNEATLNLKRELRAIGLNDKPDIYKRMVRAVSFIALIAPYIKPKHKLVWIGDEDDMLDTETRQEVLVNAFGFLADESFDVRPSALGIGTKVSEPGGEEINRAFKEILSIPDMAAGSFAAALQYDSDIRFVCPDGAAIEIIQEFSKFRPIEDFDVKKSPCCAIGSLVFDITHTDQGEPYCLPRTMQVIFDPDNDPLIEACQQDGP